MTSSAIGIYFETEEAAFCRLMWTKRGDYSEGWERITSYGRNFHENLSGLESNIRYWIKIQSEDISGNRSVSSEDSFLTYEPYTISFVPDSAVFSVDTSVEIGIKIHSFDLSNVKFRLTFNPAEIEIIGHRQGEFYSSNNGSHYSGSHDGAGFFKIAQSWRMNFENGIGVGTDADGEGISAFIMVRVLREGTSYIVFDRSQSIDLTPHSYLRDVYNNEIRTYFDTLYIHAE